MLVACFAALTLGAQAKDYKYATVPGDPMHARIYTLDNGLKVYLSVNNEKPRIQTYIAVRTGSRNDPAETTGLAHYLEHLMFKGSQKFGTTDHAKEKPYLDDIERRYEHYRKLTDPAQRKQAYHEIDSVSQIAAKYFIPNEYDKLMSAIGATGTNAYTSNDVTCYVENIPSNEVENWLKVESDRFQNMVIRGFHTELEAVYEEFNIGLAKDNRKVWESLYKLLYPTHPYGTQSTIGTQEHLKNPSITNIKNYFHRYYVPNNTAICMAGDFDPDKVIAQIDEYFGSWKKSDNLSYPQYAPVKELTAPRDTTVIGQEAAFLMMGWNFPGAASAQVDTLNVIDNILSNGKAGMFDLNVNQKMKCQYAQSLVGGMNEYSQFMLYGQPMPGQTLKDVRDIMLAEIEKLKKGEFSNDLLPSVINNLKLDYNTSLESNEWRANEFVDAFINGEKWEDKVNYINRISKITKKEIMAFAQKHFGNNYAIVYKEEGVDNTQKKIDKPQITAIPSNRDLQSQFVTEIINSKVDPIQPRFVDFNKDLTKGTTKKGLPVLYVKNNTNDLFVLSMRYNFGKESNKWLSVAKDYLDYLGTNKMTAEQLKQEYYKLACDYRISVSNDEINVSLSGLSENMAKAVALTDNFMQNAKVDKEAYNLWVESELKARQDNKKNQESNFRTLTAYGIYGDYNSRRNNPSSEELKSCNPQQLTDLIKSLNGYKHELLYYGPMELNQFTAAIDKCHKTPKTLNNVPEGKPYTKQLTQKNEILIAPYKAKNIYMTQYHNGGKQYDPKNAPLNTMFNEYFGGGMNTVVFQELREARGLAYSAWAGYYTPEKKNEPEYFCTNIISQNDKMMDCVRTFNSIMDTIPQSEKAFEIAKQAVIKRLEAQRTTKTSIIYAYLNAQKLGIDYDINKVIYEALPKITLQDLVKFTNENIAHKPFRYIILGDEKELDMKALEKIGPVKRVTTEEIFGY